MSSTVPRSEAVFAIRVLRPEQCKLVRSRCRISRYAPIDFPLRFALYLGKLTPYVFVWIKELSHNTPPQNAYGTLTFIKVLRHIMSSVFGAQQVTNLWHCSVGPLYVTIQRYMSPHDQKEPEHVVGTPHKQNTGMAVVAYVLFFVPLLTDARDDPFVRFHVKQGFVLFLCAVATSILSWLPFIMYVAWILHVGIIVLFVLGVLNALRGEENALPLVGHLADHFKF